MGTLSYRFAIDAQRRESTFFRALFCAYPVVLGRFFFGRRPSADTVAGLLLAPLFLVRNSLTGFFSTSFCDLSDYRLGLHDHHLSFGVGDDEDRHLANRYELVIHLFQAHGAWVALLYDGYLVYLPPGPEGDEAAEVIRTRR